MKRVVVNVHYLPDALEAHLLAASRPEADPVTSGHLGRGEE